MLVIPNQKHGNFNTINNEPKGGYSNSSLHRNELRQYKLSNTATNYTIWAARENIYNLQIAIIRDSHVYNTERVINGEE